MHSNGLFLKRIEIGNEGLMWIQTNQPKWPLLKCIDMDDWFLTWFPHDCHGIRALHSRGVNVWRRSSWLHAVEAVPQSSHVTATRHNHQTQPHLRTTPGSYTKQSHDTITRQTTPQSHMTHPHFTATWHGHATQPNYLTTPHSHTTPRHNQTT